MKRCITSQQCSGLKKTTAKIQLQVLKKDDIQNVPKENSKTTSNNYNSLFIHTSPHAWRNLETIHKDAKLTKIRSSIPPLIITLFLV